MNTVSTIAIGCSLPAEYEFEFGSREMAFDQIAVDAQEGAPLPDGDSGITAREALAAAWHSDLAEGIFVTARYGIYSSRYPAKRLFSGEMEPLYQNRPMWMVSLYGPGFKWPGHGSRGGPVRLSHVMHILVDPCTREKLSFFN